MRSVSYGRRSRAARLAAVVLWMQVGGWFAVASPLRGDEPARPGSAESVTDGFVRVASRRFGVAVRVPESWKLTSRERNERAFLLEFPREEEGPVGFVTCELGLAPSSLEEYQKRHAATDERERKLPKPARKLALNQVAPLDASRFDTELVRQVGKRLDSLWEYQDAAGTARYELRVRMIHDAVLYTFVMDCDEAHFDAYRLDFDDMLATLRLTKPEHGLQRLVDGSWMQSEFRFALRLPAPWRPAFGPDDKALFFATGATHEVFTDNLLGLAQPPKPLDLPALRDKMAEAVARLDPAAKVAACRIVPQGGLNALETVITTKRGPLEVTILERRFQTEKRVYEVRFTCESAEYQRNEAELRRTLDSFREVNDEDVKRVL